MKRIVKPELLDELPPGDPLAVGSRRDLCRVNAWMRNHFIMADALRNHLNGRAPGQITELGAGDGNFLLQVAHKTSARWPDVSATLLDRHKIVTHQTLASFASLGWRVEAVTADVFDWLSAGNPVEVVIANLFLHHFHEQSLTGILRAIAARARLFIAIEPRRAPLPLLCSRWLWAIGCNRVTRHDAVVSVRAGFHEGELFALAGQTKLAVDRTTRRAVQSFVHREKNPTSNMITPIQIENWLMGRAASLRARRNLYMEERRAEDCPPYRVLLLP